MAYVDHAFSISDEDLMIGTSYTVSNRPPVKEISLAVALLVFGTLGIVSGFFMAYNRVGGDRGHALWCIFVGLGANNYPKASDLVALCDDVHWFSLVTLRESFSDTHDDEVDRLLKKLNKPALKSIKSPDGDIIDSVHMRNHPIYDHPLFKNHTIQMRPSSYPDGWNNSKTEKQNKVFQQWAINGKCPKNSIPIIRTKREDILRAESIERYGKKNLNIFPRYKPTNSTNMNTHEYALLRLEVNSPQAKFHGTKAALNVWKPYVQNPREFSLAQIWVLAGPVHELNTIEVGWQVLESFYGDDRPRLFIYWTRTTGCYNIRCGGFVPINQELAIGGVIPHVSTLDGPQEVLPITIWKDPRTGHWWLKLFDHMIVGYWHSSLFNHLQNGATEINWGGEIVNLKDGAQHTSTHMGSGRFAEQGWAKASYFNDIEIIDHNEIVKTTSRLFFSCD